MKRSLQSLIDGDLDQALDVIAEHAVLGRERRVRLEKQAAGEGGGGVMNWVNQNVVDPVAQRFSRNLMPDMSNENTAAGMDALKWGLGGALAGAGVGGVSSMFQKKKRPLSSMLSGAMMGGALGAGGSLIANYGPKLTGSLTGAERANKIKEMQGKMQANRQADPGFNASPGLAGMSSKLQLPDRMVYDAITAARDLDPSQRIQAYSPLATHILQNNKQRVVGKDPSGKPIFQSWGSNPAEVMQALQSEFDKNQADASVTRTPRLSELTTAGPTAREQWNQGQYGRAIATGDVLGFKQPLSLIGLAHNNSEGIWRDTQRLLGPTIGGGPKLNDDVRGLFKPVDASKGINQWGLDPTEAVQAIGRGPEGREDLWQRLKGRSRYNLVPAQGNQPERWEAMPWGDNDRQQYEDLLKQVEDRSGMWQWPRDRRATFGNSYWDMTAATAGADLVGSQVRNLYNKRLTNPDWIIKALESGKFSRMPDLEKALNNISQSKGEAGLTDLLGKWKKGEPLRFGGTTIDPAKLEQIANQVGATPQPDITELRKNYQNEMTALGRNESTFTRGQLKVLGNELQKLERQANIGTTNFQPQIQGAETAFNTLKTPVEAVLPGAPAGQAGRVLAEEIANTRTQLARLQNAPASVQGLGTHQTQLAQAQARLNQLTDPAFNAQVTQLDQAAGHLGGLRDQARLGDEKGMMQMRTRLQQMTGEKAPPLTGGGRPSLQNMQQELQQLGKMQFGVDRHPLEYLHNMPGVGSENTNALKALDARLSSLSPEAQTSVMKDIAGQIESQLPTLGKGTRGGPPQLVRIPIPGSSEMLSLDARAAKHLLGDMGEHTVSPADLGRLAGIGPGAPVRPGSAVTIPEIVALAKSGQPIPGASAEEMALMQRLAAQPGVLEEVLTAARGGASRTFGETVVPGASIMDTVRRQAAEVVPETRPFWRRGIAGTPLPRAVGYAIPAVIAEQLFNRGRVISDPERMIREEDPNYRSLSAQDQGQ